MSNDPNQPERRPSPYPNDPQRYPPGHDPYAAAFGDGADPQKAKRRLFAPGIFVVIIAVMNLVTGGCCLGFGLFAQTIPDAQLKQETEKWSSPEEMEKAKKQGQDPVAMAKGMYLYGGIGVGSVAFFLALVAFIGGGCMIAGRSMFLCSMGALAVILSPGGFGLVGLAVGIWAFVVLFNEDVRAAFRKA